MEKNSCWYFPYCKRYYLTHPWIWVRDLWRNFRDVRMRVQYGFTYGDIWDWDMWFLRTAPQMFRYIAEHGSAYPGHEPFETPERWHDWLNEMAGLLESGREEWQEKHNEYHEEYMARLMDKWKKPTEDNNGLLHARTPEKTELDNKYWNRANELAQQGEDNVRRALTCISEHFYDIWD